MAARRWGSFLHAFALALLPVAARAIEADNVLVLYNAASSEGAQIAAHYAAVHPGARLLSLANVSAADEITLDAYLQTIRPQVQAALTPSTEVIVTTKGLPVRINTTQRFSSLPATYTDPFGVTHTVYSTSWEPYSSLESELTRVDQIGGWKQALDQTWWDPTIQSHAANPYFNRGIAFDRTDPLNQSIRLTSRLDGYNAADVIASIDRAQHARTGPFQFVLDDDPTKPFDAMPSLAANVLQPQGQPFTYDNTAGFVGTATGPVMGYVSYGRNQASTPPNYLTDLAGGLQINLAPGAVFHTWESYNAYSFNQGGNVVGQGLVAEWIHRGGTAGIGHVQEPYATLANVTNEDILFNMLLAGYTWVEAAWAATPQLSFVNTIVGDPLMVWRPLMAGDVDGDGRVGSADLASFTANWGYRGPGGGASWAKGDFDGDGLVGASDMALFSSHWGEVSDWAQPGGGPPPGYGGLPRAAQAIPEPSTLLLSLLAGAAVALRARRRT